MAGGLGTFAAIYLNFFMNQQFKNNFILVILAIILISISLWRLPYSPATWFDEGINLGIAKSLVNKGVFSLEIGPDDFVAQRQFLITTNYPVLLPVAASMKFFGFNLMAARLPMVLFLILFSLAAYLLVKKLYSKEAAIMSLALIVSFISFYGNGKVVLGEIPGLFYFLCGLLLLGSDFNWRRLFLAGMFFGLSAATKPFFLIILPAILIGEFFSYRKLGTKFWRRILIIGAGLLPPLVIWLFTILPKFSLSEISAVVNYYLNSYGATDFWPLIISNFLRFFSEATPLYFLLLFLAAFLFAAFKKKRGEPLQTIEIILLVFILLNTLWYLKTPGWYRYFFPAHMILFLFFPASLACLFNKKAAIVVVTALFLIQLPYLINLMGKNYENTYNSQKLVVFSQQAMEQTEPGSKVFIIYSPSIAFLLNDRQIYQYLQINPVIFFGKNTLMQENDLYPYIIKKNALPVDTIDRLDEILKSNYKIINEFGHYVLYKKL